MIFFLLLELDLVVCVAELSLFKSKRFVERYKQLLLIIIKCFFFLSLHYNICTYNNI